MKLKIKELREEFHMTQRELAEKISNVQRNVSNWENGTSEPDCETIMKLAQLFNVSIDELFGMQEYRRAEKEHADGDKKLYFAFRRLNEEQKEAIYNLILSFE